MLITLAITQRASHRARHKSKGDNMEPRKLIEFMGVIEKLKCNTRHSWTSSGRHESVAEHCWRLAVLALLVKDQFPEADFNKVLTMCLIHDFGEALTGDIPSFNKTQQHEEEEEQAVKRIVSLLPPGMARDYQALFDEMAALQTLEARLVKALDKLEVLLSHNEAPLSTWIPREYTLNLSYGQENVAFSDYLAALREEIRQDSERKIAGGQ